MNYHTLIDGGERCLEPRIMFVRFGTALVNEERECRVDEDGELHLIPTILPEEWWDEIGWSLCNEPDESVVLNARLCSTG